MDGLLLMTREFSRVVIDDTKAGYSGLGPVWQMFVDGGYVRALPCVVCSGVPHKLDGSNISSQSRFWCVGLRTARPYVHGAIAPYKRRGPAAPKTWADGVWQTGAKVQARILAWLPSWLKSWLTGYGKSVPARVYLPPRAGVPVGDGGDVASD